MKPTQKHTCIQRIQGVGVECSSQQAKQPKREFDHSPPSNGEVKKSGVTHLLPPTTICFHGMDMDAFLFARIPYTIVRVSKDPVSSLFPRVDVTGNS
jgi:hypothetical protein